MDVPDFDGSRTSSRSTVIDSIRGCGMPIFGTPKRDLRQKIMMPQYLRLAMRDAIESKDVAAGDSHFASASSVGEVIPPSEAPLVVFINSRSGGRHGPEVKSRLQDLMGEEQVFDLQFVRPHEFVQHGLGCLERLADLGDLCAEKTREKLRIVVAGGDGTVGWVLGCLGELHKQRREPVPPTAIIPLGTGNDLSRSFGWGGSFPFNWKSAIKRTLDKASAAPISRLDSWKISVSMPSGEIEDPPHCLRSLEECSLDQILDSLSNFKCGCNTPVIKTLYISEQLMDLEDNGVQTERELPEKVQTEGELPEKVSQYEGVFYNYFSIGMDAQIAYGFHHLRNEKPHLAQGPIANKLIYSGYGCTQGWFFTQCKSDPGLRGLKNIVRLYIKKVNCSDWEQVSIPSSVRSIVALNLNSYASGRNPWGNLKPEYLEKRGFVEAQVDDGLLEIFGLKQGWHASFVMTELISAKHIAQAAMIRFELRGGEWKEAYLQIDGEPWKQPMNNFRSTFIEIGRVPFQSVMIDGNGE